MAGYQPPFTITNEMVSLVSSISEKLGQLSNYKSFESKPHLRKNNRIRSIHSSLAIEANSLSLDQVKSVIDGRLVIGPQKEIQEVKNAYKAYDEIGTFDPFSLDELKRLHGVMTYLTVDESGTFRRGEEGVFDGDRCIFMAPPAHLVHGQMAELFQRERSGITKHIKNVFAEGEVDEKSNVKNIHIANSDKPVAYYSLDVIISVGYRVKSLRGTQFRIWANSILKEYLIKGFAMNDELLKQAGGGNYFDELMDRIRDIRSSEKVFWRKVLDIYATSVDYDPRTESSVLFFKTVQNKMHWAAHGQTAAEKIFYSVDSSKPNMGLHSFSGNHPTQSDALIAKNYCTEDELLALNDIVSAYLDLAEMQARRRIPMYMSDWIDTLDGFLKLSKHEILTHAGKISAATAEKKAKEEYRKYKELQSAELSRGEKDYIAALESAEQKLLKKSNQ